MNSIIEIKDVGKLYRLGELGTGTLSHDLKRWMARLRGKEDPFSKVGVVNDRTQKSNGNEYVWALRHISLNVSQGDVVGIIGKNGAGKSTLLKILSRISAPSTGHVKIKGRIGSLLEVGTGFHHEMTGRENIYMNGTILGMRRHEITSKFEEIVEFAGVAKYIDTPVKRYSSGMMVRLGFAVAAHLEPEILIVDEVLAVGDAEFQKKALGKMKHVSQKEGRTVLFVSHNIAAISQLCESCVFLRAGEVEFIGKTAETIHRYTHSDEKSLPTTVAQIKGIHITESNLVGNVSGVIDPNSSIEAYFILETEVPLPNCFINFVVEDSENTPFIHARTDVDQGNWDFRPGVNKVRIRIRRLGIKPGHYNAWFRLFVEIDGQQIMLDSQPMLLVVSGSKISGLVSVQSQWDKVELLS